MLNLVLLTHSKPFRVQSCCLTMKEEVAMPVVIAYSILEAASRVQLETLVKEAISKGWQPVGGVSVSGGMFYQAMAGH